MVWNELLLTAALRERSRRGDRLLDVPHAVFAPVERDIPDAEVRVHVRRGEADVVDVRADPVCRERKIIAPDADGVARLFHGIYERALLDEHLHPVGIDAVGAVEPDVQTAHLADALNEAEARLLKAQVLCTVELVDAVSPGALAGLPEARKIVDHEVRRAALTAGDGGAA